ncbi:hypothetical protein BV898_01558 [Hypsibius exemplaris]|uniref:Uncharacterized protein n=1 Tax=Hypsibius exemplaris TaxID=2072580 RepID=A0A1W0XAE4_HYPEX|nr:hypothetical protein BV898_01558 [Hypsibius exemplaris]
MDGFQDGADPVRKIGVHINSDFQVAIVSSDVTSNSAKILDQSLSYLDGTKELLSRSGDIIDLAKESVLEIEKQRHRVLAGRQHLLAIREGRSPARLKINAAIAALKAQCDSKRRVLDGLLAQEEQLQKKIDQLTKPAAAAV